MAIVHKYYKIYNAYNYVIPCIAETIVAGIDDWIPNRQ